MNLAIDIGNSRVKYAVFEDNKCLEFVKTDMAELVNKLENVKQKYVLSSAILALVSGIDEGILKKLKSLFKLIILDKNLKLPFNVLYKTKDTLGVDRLALIAASVNNYPQQNVLIIDAGTCITYDFITKENDYLGGAISPGITMRYKSLNNQTKNLPLLKPKYPKNITGNTTKQSIHSGVCTGVINEIEGVISHYKAKYSNLTVVLTGGDTNFLAEKLKSGIFANPNFLLEGLNHILNHNLQE